MIEIQDEWNDILGESHLLQVDTKRIFLTSPLTKKNLPDDKKKTYRR